MKSTNEYLIPFIGLKIGKHQFDFQINKKFFEEFGFDEFESCDLKVNVAFEKKGDFVIPINKETGKPFPGEFIEYFKEKKFQRYFDVHDNNLVIKSFPGFHSSPETLGKILNLDVIKDYQRANNKMIVTGRDEELRSFIIDVFKELNLELPNYGLILYQKGSQSIKDYKTEIILKTIELNNWDEVHFYEDRADWLYHAEGAVKEKFPNVKFISHLITNIKDKMKM